MIEVAARIQELHKARALHIKRGFCICDANALISSNHMLEEAVELQAAVIDNDRDEIIKEAGDVVLCLLHTLQHSDITAKEVLDKALQRLDSAFTTDPSKITAIKNGFSRTNRGSEPAAE